MGKDARAIRQEIEDTRERMGDTIEALGYKADVPSRVKENVQDKVETVKETISDVVDNVKSAMGGASGRVGEALGGSRERGSSLLADTKDRLNDTVSSVSGKVSDMTNSLQSQSTDVSRQAKRAVGLAVENPVGLAIGALAVGFLAGLMVPVTDIERERIGPLREKIVEGAQSAADDLIATGKTVVQETANAAMQAATQSVKSAASSHGLTSPEGETHGSTGSTAEYGKLLDEPVGGATAL
ncbi:MAG: hypothetical protein NVSMB64_02970 [Candidatus Velthaea sp.]